MGTGVGRVGPIAHAANDADALLPNLHNLGDHEVDWCHPFASLPVVGIFALWRKAGAKRRVCRGEHVTPNKRRPISGD